MPYPNEHSARLRNPDDFNSKTFKRGNDGIIYGKIKVPKTIAVIWAKLKGKDKPRDNPIPQALRFPVKYWTVEKAKKWLKDNNVKYQRFEPAKKEKKDRGMVPALASQEAAGTRVFAGKGKYDCECIKCGHTMQSDKHCKDIKCPKCGGQMRRKERPGPGRSDMASHNIFALIAQLETEIWAMESHALEAFFTQLSREQTYLPDRIEIEIKVPSLQVRNGVAIIGIHGILMKQIPGIFRFFGIEATSYVDIARQVREALTDSKVQSILLHVDSPGGMVAGVLETADIIREAREHKPVSAMIEDIGASGAYWLASQANVIAAERNTTVGSIGVYTVYVDSSKWADELGFKVHIIRSGEYKGMGLAGVEITEHQIAAMQEMIDGIADNFVNSVATGRKRPAKEVKEWATGRMWLADKAVELGLIDGIKLTSKSILEFDKETKVMEHENENVDELTQANQLREETVANERRRLADLRGAFPEDVEFAMKAFEEGWTLEQAKAQRHDILQQQMIKTERAKIAEEQQSKQTVGARVIVSGDSDNEVDGDFLIEARELADKKEISMTAAMKRVAHRKPELHEAFKARSAAMGKEAVYSEV